MPVIPALWAPFPSAINPGQERAARENVDWLDHHRICASPRERARMRASCPEGLAARGYPVADPERLRWATDFVSLLFAIDDSYCDEGPLVKHPADLCRIMTQLQWVVNTPHAHTTGLTPIASGLRDLRLRLDELAHPVQVARWVATMRTYLLTQTLLAHNRSAGVVPSLNDYLLVRTESGGIKPFTAIHDVIGGYVLPERDWTSSAAWVYAEAFSLIICAENDLVSYHKEAVAGTSDRQNFVDIVMAERGCAVEEAVAEVVLLHDRTMRLYLTLRTQIEALAGTELRRWLSTSDAWLRGQHEWSLEARRYTGHNSAAGLPTTLADTPTADSDLNQPYPAEPISWWWDLLDALPLPPHANPRC
ncbi:hypothetical protein AB0K15_17685 [Amycolatopsis sp. NPDC049253]|uniref:terpene synthase family protein n=1 Tax=Amycolatopsis sp. NPDC049253 TaxID=3155274 RepID=UPI0034415857